MARRLKETRREVGGAYVGEYIWSPCVLNPACFVKTPWRHTAAGMCAASNEFREKNGRAPRQEEWERYWYNDGVF
jgi:hypothetical protein